MATTNTLPMVNFVREYGWNPVEANLLGASSFFSGDTPLENVLGSIDAFNLSHGLTTQKPKFCADRKGKVVSCDSPDAVPYPQRDGVTNDPNAQGGVGSGSTTQTPGTRRPDGTLIPENERQRDADGGIPLTPDEAQKYIDASKEKPNIFDDWFKRIALVLAGLIILGVAIASLR